MVNAYTTAVCKHIYVYEPFPYTTLTRCMYLQQKFKTLQRTFCYCMVLHILFFFYKVLYIFYVIFITCVRNNVLRITIYKSFY